jgi:putative sterol carrier protein
MPFGLNKETAQGVDIVVQFDLSGVEAGESYLIIKDQKCTHTYGVHEAPTVTVRADSDLWLAITNGERDGDKAFINNEYEIKGDATVMLSFESYFDQSATFEEIKDRAQDYPYASLEKPIKKIVVFDGGYRNKKLSKTTLMVDQFVAGAKSAGAEVREYKLSELEIKDCTGCYTCWTKTPGECVTRDIMDELRVEFRSADLVVFASPLYIFNVTGIMKTFMDRLLPIMKPYMLLDPEDGHILHPDRYPEHGKQGLVVFSASGFPDVENNFDGLKAMYRAFASHSEPAELMGEFFLTAAEILAQPVYRDRRAKVEQACYNAGVQVVKEGKIDYQHMADVSNPGISHKTFQSQADAFWESMDGKKAYLRGVPKI